MQGILYKGLEAPCPLPTTEILPSKPRIHFVWLLGIQAVVSSCLGFTVHLFHTDTHRKAQSHRIHLCCGKREQSIGFTTCDTGTCSQSSPLIYGNNLLYSSTVCRLPRPVKVSHTKTKKIWVYLEQMHLE